MMKYVYWMWVCAAMVMRSSLVYAVDSNVQLINVTAIINKVNQTCDVFLKDRAGLPVSNNNAFGDFGDIVALTIQNAPTTGIQSTIQLQPQRLFDYLLMSSALYGQAQQAPWSLVISCPMAPSKANAFNLNFSSASGAAPTDSGSPSRVPLFLFTTAETTNKNNLGVSLFIRDKYAGTSARLNEYLLDKKDYFVSNTSFLLSSGKYVSEHDLFPNIHWIYAKTTGTQLYTPNSLLTSVIDIVVTTL